jgi:hypothetical protein
VLAVRAASGRRALIRVVVEQLVVEAIGRLGDHRFGD